MTVVRFAVGVTEGFRAKVGLHQVSGLSSFLFAMVIDRLTGEVRQESWWMMSANDIFIRCKNREQVEENLERWMYVLERRGMKVLQRSKKYISKKYVNVC